MTRPWINPSDVKDYTDFTNVSSRADAKLLVDISRAEKYVIACTNNDFAEDEELPPDVRTAVLLLAEAYAQNAALAAAEKMTSETFDDYSYTAADASVNIDALDIKTMLEGYVITKGKGAVTMSLTKL